jgi:NAD(P)-dependent dehydrogenase (short-subunit alcohol dehydrogenase family)
MFGVTYSPSKTALNAITLAFALDLESTGIKVNAACPGFTATGLNNCEVHARSNRRRVSQCASRPLTRTARRARSRTRTARSRDDVVSKARLSRSRTGRVKAGFSDRCLLGLFTHDFFKPFHKGTGLCAR